MNKKPFQAFRRIKKEELNIQTQVKIQQYRLYSSIFPLFPVAILVCLQNVSTTRGLGPSKIEMNKLEQCAIVRFLTMEISCDYDSIIKTNVHRITCVWKLNPQINARTKKTKNPEGKNNKKRPPRICKIKSDLSGYERCRLNTEHWINRKTDYNKHKRKNRDSCPISLREAM